MARQTDDPRPKVSPKVAAFRLGVSDRQVRELAKRGELRAVKIGRLLRIDAADLDRVLEHGTGP